MTKLSIIEKTPVADSVGDIEVHIVQVEGEDIYRVWGYDVEYEVYLHTVVPSVSTYKCDTLELARVKAQQLIKPQPISVSV